MRIHQLPPGPTIEGVLTGRHGGHYMLATPRLLEAADRTHQLDGAVWVPAERVLFVQVIG